MIFFFVVGEIWFKQVYFTKTSWNLYRITYGVCRMLREPLIKYPWSRSAVGYYVKFKHQTSILS